MAPSPVPSAECKEDATTVAADAAAAAAVVISRLLPHDVVCGRGELAVANPGNIRFRQLVEENRAEYRNAPRRLRKDAIARAVIQTIHQRGGRFLQRLDLAQENNGSSNNNKQTAKKPPVLSASASGSTNSGGGPALWTVADDEMVLLKVKQALRGKKTAPSEAEQEQPPCYTVESARLAHASQSSMEATAATTSVAAAVGPAEAAAAAAGLKTTGDLQGLSHSATTAAGAPHTPPWPYALQALNRVDAWLTLQNWQRNLSSMHPALTAAVPRDPTPRSSSNNVLTIDPQLWPLILQQAQREREDALQLLRTERRHWDKPPPR